MSKEIKVRSSKELRDALATVRGTARMRMHLLSLEARERWQDLEARLDTLQTKLEREGERAGEGAAKKVRELTHAVRDFMREHQPASQLGMEARQLMHTPTTCSPADTLNEAARQMWERNCGAIPVVDQEGHLVGILTDRDMCMAAYTRGQPLSAISVESTMSRQVASVAPGDSLAHVASLMRERQIRRVPVVEDGRLVGMLALADLAQFVEGEAGFDTAASMELTHTLAAISAPQTAGASAAAE